MPIKALLELLLEYVKSFRDEYDNITGLPKNINGTIRHFVETGAISIHLFITSEKEQ